jgi:branched-chain amino acid transport system permease protein
MTDPSSKGAIDRLVGAGRLRPLELLPWAVAVGAYFLFDSYLALGSQILIMVLFALSLDLIVGYAGIVTLGHAAFFGVGAYAAGILARHGGWSEPISGLLISGAVAGAVGLASGFIVLRTTGLTLLMLTMATGAMLFELANKAGGITGGADGLQGIAIDPVLGLFRFDLWGRTTYLYSLAVVFLCWLFARRLVHSPFGRSLVGIRENVQRMHAIGSPVFRRMLTIYGISATMAGIAGALLTQTTQFAALKVLSFEMSGEILVMLILGGVGRLYGAFLGVPGFMIAQDAIAKTDPYNWFFWIGLMLVLVVLFVRGGILGICDTIVARIRRRP